MISLLISSRIGILSAVAEVLLRQPFFLFRRFRNVDPFDLDIPGKRGASGDGKGLRHIILPGHGGPHILPGQFRYAPICK